MPYKDKIEISEVEPYLLDGLKNFIEEILDLREIYGNEIKIPVANPPKKYTEMANRLMIGGFDSTAFTFTAKGIDNDPIRGIYQDEALLKESADIRLNKVVILKKLGVISNISINDAPLELRGVIFFVREPEIKELLVKIEQIFTEKERAKKEYERKQNEIYYNEESSTMNLENKIPIQVSGWEDAICKVFFNPTRENKEIDFGEIVYEMTGEQYQKSENPQHMDSIRQAVYRINKKINKNFDKKDYLYFSTKTRKLTKTQTN